MQNVRAILKVDPVINRTSDAVLYFLFIYLFKSSQSLGFLNSGSSVVECSLMVRWVVGSVSHGGPIELFFVSAIAPQLVVQRSWYVLSCLWDRTHKGSVTTN